MSLISVVIPNRENENPYQTLDSLAVQTVPFETIIVYDEGKGANWARNRGAELARGDYLLFSDNDIVWEKDALENLYMSLTSLSSPSHSYCYGWYTIDGFSYCQQPFSERILRQRNFISTMTLIRREVFPDFDESLKRLQDWDLWLSLLEKNIYGIFCNRKIFSTTKREGITSGLEISWEEAERIVREKHGI